MLRGLYHFAIWCSYYGLGSITAHLLPTTTNADMLRFLNEYLQPWEIDELSCIYCEIQTYYRLILGNPSGIVSCSNPDTHFFKLVYQDLFTSNVLDVSEGISTVIPSSVTSTDTRLI